MTDEHHLAGESIRKGKKTETRERDRKATNTQGIREWWRRERVDPMEP